MSVIPRLDLLKLDWDLDLVSQSQSSSQNVSQFTPLASQQSASSIRPPSHFSINLPDSSHSAASYRLPSDLGHYSPSLTKPPHQPGVMDQYHPLLDDEVPLSGVGLEIDEDGNMIGILDEQIELPPLPGTTDDNYEAQAFQKQFLDAGEQPPHLSQQDRGHGLVIMGEQALPDAEAFPSRAPVRQSSPPSSTPSLETSETERAVAPIRRRGRPKKHQMMLDRNDHISRKEIRNWSENYVANMDRLRNRPKVTSLAQAKKNARAFLYGNGIANVGAPITGDNHGLTHPLADDFAGSFLRTRLHGRQIDNGDQNSKPKRGRRRKRSEAFPEE